MICRHLMPHQQIQVHPCHSIVFRPWVATKCPQCLQCTVVWDKQKTRRKYWATCLSIRLFARTACSGLLTSLAPSTALMCSLARSLSSLPCLWENEFLMSQNDLVLSHSAMAPLAMAPMAMDPLPPMPPMVPMAPMDPRALLASMALMAPMAPMAEMAPGGVYPPPLGGQPPAGGAYSAPPPARAYQLQPGATYKQYQRKARKKLCVLVGVGVVAAIILILVIYFSVKSDWRADEGSRWCMWWGMR